MELPHTEIQKYIKLIGKRKYLFIFASKRVRGKE
jgi:hypothetical protein